MKKVLIRLKKPAYYLLSSNQATVQPCRGHLKWADQVNNLHTQNLKWADQVNNLHTIQPCKGNQATVQPCKGNLKRADQVNNLHTQDLITSELHHWAATRKLTAHLYCTDWEYNLHIVYIQLCSNYQATFSLHGDYNTVQTDVAAHLLRARVGLYLKAQMDTGQFMVVQIYGKFDFSIHRVKDFIPVYGCVDLYSLHWQDQEAQGNESCKPSHIPLFASMWAEPADHQQNGKKVGGWYKYRGQNPSNLKQSFPLLQYY